MKGRPYGEGLEEAFKVRVSPSLAARIRASASRQGISVSTWLRTRAEHFLDGQQDTPEVRTEPRRNGLTETEVANTSTLIAEGADVAGALRSATAKVTGKPAPNEPQDVGETFALPHIVQDDGSCAGGCDPDIDMHCTLSATDPLRTGKRRRG